jgi:hypothetical protein
MGSITLGSRGGCIMGRRFGVLPARTSPRFVRHDPHEGLVLVFMEKDHKRRFRVPTHTAVGKACMKILKSRVESGMLRDEACLSPQIPEGYTEADVADIDKKRFCMLPKPLKAYKAHLTMWAKKNNALERALRIIEENDLDAARDFIEDRGDLPYERYKFQELESIE